MVLTGLGIAVAASLWPAAPAGLDAEGRIEAAIHQEIVLGDLRGRGRAVSAVIGSSASKVAVARALYRYARCLEKLEPRPKAYDIYRRIEKEYSDQAEAAMARALLANWEYSVSESGKFEIRAGYRRASCQTGGLYQRCRKTSITGRSYGEAAAGTAIVCGGPGAG